jgi:hypothetical protein
MQSGIRRYHRPGPSSHTDGLLDDGLWYGLGSNSRRAIAPRGLRQPSQLKQLTPNAANAAKVVCNQPI